MKKKAWSIILIVLGIFIIAVGGLLLYLNHNYKKAQAAASVKIPYAKIEISSDTLITEEMIGYIDVSLSFVDDNPNLITNGNLIVNHRVSKGMIIPKNSYFYQEMIAAKK